MRRVILCGLVLGLLALPLLAEISFAEERQIALWILRRGGQVMVDGVENPIGDPFDLPDRDFRIVMVDMHGTVIEPKQLQEISKLEHVRELYVPARVWSPVSDVKAPFSDESFQYYQGMKQLETFSAGLTTLAWLDIGDEGVKRLSSALPAQTSPAEQHYDQGPQVLRSARQSGVSRSWRRLRAGLFAGSAGQHEEPEAPEPAGHLGYR